LPSREKGTRIHASTGIIAGVIGESKDRKSGARGSFGGLEHKSVRSLSLLTLEISKLWLAHTYLHIPRTH
jgi:hypothetical protein